MVALSRVLPFLAVLCFAYFFAAILVWSPGKGNQSRVDHKNDELENESDEALILQHLPATLSDKSSADLWNSAVYSSITKDYNDPGTAKKSNVLLGHLIQSAAEKLRDSVVEINVTERPSLGNWTLLEKAFDGFKYLENVH
jgi:hypothetical protein